MAKIRIEPVRLTSMGKQALGYGKSPIKDHCLVTFSPEGAKVAFGLAGDVLVYAQYNKEYFKAIDAASEEAFVFTLSLVKERLAYGFKGEEVTMHTDAQKVYLTGTTKDDTADEALTAVTTEMIEAKAPFSVAMTDLGLVMDKLSEPFNLQALISQDTFADLPVYETVTFDTDGKSLTMYLGDQLGNRKRPVTIKQYANANKPQVEPVGTPLKVTYNMKLIQQLINIFDGDVWLSINGGALVLSQKQKDYALTYVISAYEEPKPQ